MRLSVIPIAILSLTSFMISIVAVAISTAADPSISKPNFVLPIHGFMEEAKLLAEQCEKDTNAALKTYETLRKANKPPTKESVNQLSVIEKRMQRYAERLLTLAESAGGEYTARQKVHRAQFDEAYSAFPSNPKYQEIIAQTVIELQRSSKSRHAKANEIAAKHKQDAVAAEAMLDAALDELESKAGILPSSERSPFSEFEEIRRIVFPENESMRRKRTNEAIEKHGKEIAADFDKFIAKIQGAASSVRSGRATYGETTIDATEFIETLFRDSNAMVVKLQKMVGMQSWIQNPKIGYGPSGPPPAIDAKWAERIRTLRTEIAKVVAMTLENDSKEIPANLAMSRLSAYVAILGKHAHRADGDEWISAFDEAVLGAAKRLNISEPFAAYQRSTADVLAFRERFAQKQESVLAKQGTRLLDVLVKGSNKTQTEPGYFFIGTGVPPPELHDPTFVALPAMGKAMPKEPMVTVGNVVRMDTEAAVWVSKWDNFTYARLPETFYKADAGKLLAGFLNTDESHPPLTVRSASAIYSAERGDRLTVGGVAKEVYVEGAATRLQTLPDAGSTFVGYSQAVNMPRNQIHVAKVASLRVAVVPRWYRHRYFVVAKIGS